MVHIAKGDTEDGDSRGIRVPRGLDQIRPDLASRMMQGDGTARSGAGPESYRGGAPTQRTAPSRGGQIRISIGQKLTLSYLLLALLVGVLGFVGYSNMRETRKQVDVMRRESDGLRTLSDMKSHVLEGIEEAFAYPLLNDPHEKEEFYAKLDNFDTFVASFSEGPFSITRGQEEEF